MLAFYIFIAAAIVVGGLVNLGNQHLASYSISDLWYIVGDARWGKRATSGRSNPRRLRCKFESRKVSSSP